MKQKIVPQQLSRVSLAGFLLVNLTIPQFSLWNSQILPQHVNPVTSFIEIPQDTPLVTVAKYVEIPEIEMSDENLLVETEHIVESEPEIETQTDQTQTQEFKDSSDSIKIDTQLELAIVEPTPEPAAIIEDTPIPEPIEPEFISTPFDDLYQEYADRYSIDVNLLKKIAACESGHNPTSVNGDYLGMFQFSSGTWQSTRAEMSLDPNPDLRTDPTEAIHTAAFKIGAGGAHAWAACL